MMRLVSVHGDGSPHRSWNHAEATSDPWCFWIPAGSAVAEADGREWSSSYPVVALFWPGQYYQVFLLLKAGTTEYYCNLIAPPVYRPGGRVVQFTDLDVDVVVDGSGVRVVDEDEFAVRQQAYPTLWVASVTQARVELVALAQARCGPFSPATANRWRDYAQAVESD